MELWQAGLAQRISTWKGERIAKRKGASCALKKANDGASIAVRVKCTGGGIR